MSDHVKILALPIFRRYWLYHAWHDPQAATLARAVKDWRKGVNLEEKMQLLSEKMQLWASMAAALAAECSYWHGLAESSCMLLVGLGETGESVEEHGACQGTHDQKLHVQVLYCPQKQSLLPPRSTQVHATRPHV